MLQAKLGGPGAKGEPATQKLKTAISNGIEGIGK